jgi:hypothetical protein
VVRNHDRSRHGKKRFMSSMNDFVWAKDPRLSSPSLRGFLFGLWRIV